MLRRAVREPLLIIGLLLVLVGATVALVELHDVRAQADRDYAHCRPAQPPSDCTSRRRPSSVETSRSSSNAFRAEYALVVETGPRSTLSLTGLERAEVAPFEGAPSVEVRSRNGHTTALVAADGTTLEVPFIFSKRLFVITGAGAAVGLLGAGLVAIGLTRVNRTPR